MRSPPMAAPSTSWTTSRCCGRSARRCRIERRHLFAPAPAIRGSDRGLAIDYFLRRPASRVAIEILDAAGQVVRSFTATPAGARGGPRPRTRAPAPGSNRFTWDMRYSGFMEFPGMILWAARRWDRSRVPGPVPGAADRRRAGADATVRSRRSIRASRASRWRTCSGASTWPSQRARPQERGE